MCYLVSDGERKVGNRSPSPKAGGMGSVDHTFIKDEVNAVQAIEQVDGYIDDMKKGTSNILVNINFH
jgi:hypothetical protein